jgi:hypothetical protein
MAAKHREEKSDDLMELIEVYQSTSEIEILAGLLSNPPP